MTKTHTYALKYSVLLLILLIFSLYIVKFPGHMPTVLFSFSLVPTTVAKSCITFSIWTILSLTHTVVPSAICESCISPSTLNGSRTPLIRLHYLIFVVDISVTRRNRSGEIGQPCYIPITSFETQLLSFTHVATSVYNVLST